MSGPGQNGHPAGETADQFAEHMDRLLAGGGQHYLQLLDALPTPVVFYDSQGKALFVNHAFVETYGFSRREILGKMVDFVPAEEVEPTLAVWRRTLAGEKVRFETRRYTKDGCIRNIEIFTAIIKDRDGGHLASVVIHNDITEAQKAREQKLAREKLQACIETAGAVCHEMSQPLQVIAGAVSLSRVRIGDSNPTVLKRLENITDQVYRLKGILKKLKEITDFKTKPYVDDCNILDLERASSEKPRPLPAPPESKPPTTK